ncbi:MAG TPA: hypothetical protein VGR92_04545 [Steroidobacteraceae bacterium]|nr:hypothetical protein [Steroidobacteraceae bacterium]
MTTTSCNWAGLLSVRGVLRFLWGALCETSCGAAAELPDGASAANVWAGSSPTAHDAIGISSDPGSFSFSIAFFIAPYLH